MHCGTVSFCTPVIVASYVGSGLVIATGVFCDVFILHTLSISLLLCSCYCSMPPARATRVRGHPSRLPGQPESVATLPACQGNPSPWPPFPPARATRVRGHPSRLPGHPEAVADLPAKLRTCVTLIPVPMLCQLIQTPFPFWIVLPRRGLTHQGRCPLWTLLLFSQCLSVALPCSVPNFGLSRRTWPWRTARGIETMRGELLRDNVGEIHDMVLNLRQTPAVAAAPATLGSAAVCFSGCANCGRAVPLVPAAAGPALLPYPAPWPSEDICRMSTLRLAFGLS